jgi:uncharacterized membrane protein (UPF0127 family)
MKSIILLNPRSQIKIQTNIANSFYTKFLGLMGRKNIPMDFGLLLSEKSESIINTSIHMLFMRFDITAIWLDHDFNVISVQLAKKWHLAYASKKPAMHVLELHSSQFKNFSIGDKLEINQN